MLTKLGVLSQTIRSKINRMKIQCFQSLAGLLNDVTRVLNWDLRSRTAVRLNFLICNKSTEFRCLSMLCRLFVIWPLYNLISAFSSYQPPTPTKLQSRYTCHSLSPTRFMAHLVPSAYKVFSLFYVKPAFTCSNATSDDTSPVEISQFRCPGAVLGHTPFGEGFSRLFQNRCAMYEATHSPVPLTALPATPAWHRAHQKCVIISVKKVSGQCMNVFCVC